MRPRKPKRSHVTRYGEGSFKYDPRRNLWVGRYDTGDLNANGGRVIITASARKEDDAWNRFLAAKKKHMLEGPKPEGVKPNMTVKTWSAEWLVQHEKQVRDKTFMTDRANIKNWVVPNIGKVRLEKLTAAHMRKVGAAPLAAGRSRSTANSAQRTLTKMLNAAKVDGYLIPDSVFAQTKTALGASDRTRMSVEQVSAVFELAYQQYPDAIRFFLAVLYGSRRAEILGLTWDRVRFYTGVKPDAVVVGEMELSKQIQPLRYKDRARGVFHVKDGEEHLVEHIVDAWHFTPTKTEAGDRVLPIIAPVAVELKRWRDACPTGERNPHNLVFPRIRGQEQYLGYPRNQHADAAEWRDLQRDAGVYKREPDPAVEGDTGQFYVLHEARHSMISMLRDAGVSKHVIEMLVGQTALVESYSHSELAAAGEAVGMLAGLLPKG